MPMMAMLAHVLNFPEEAVVRRSKRPGRAPSSRTSPPTRSRGGRVLSKTFAADGKYALVAPEEVRGAIGYDNMLDGGAIDALTSSTIGRNNAYARSNPPPVFDRDVCIDCAKCFTVCADPGAIVWKDGKMAGIDLTYCKACMRCVARLPDDEKRQGAARSPEGVTSCAF